MNRFANCFTTQGYLPVDLPVVAPVLCLSYDWTAGRLLSPVGEFGDKFRKAREKKNLSLDDVSNVTKIGSRMLQAIEEEHFDQLPGGVFNKGFIRAYAKHLGLNDEQAVTDYLACLRQAQIDAHEVWQPDPPAHVPAAPEKRPLAYIKPSLQQTSAEVEELPDLQLPRAEDVRPPRREFNETPSRGIPWSLVAVAVVMIALAVVVWNRRSHTARTSVAAPPTISQTQPAPVVASAQAPTVQPIQTPPAAATSTTQRPATSKTQTSQPVSPAASPTRTPTNSPATGENNSDVTIRHITPASAPPAKAPPAFTLIIRATENSWISVQADGQTVSEETLIAPAHTSVRASREIVARIGNAAGVTFLWNGQEIPADGAEAEVKTFVFDAEGMHAGPASQPSSPR